jgi:hypothetical protein
MFTTGFKFFFGLCLALAVAAVVYGYTTGGTHVGPISLGWKGGVGDQLGYGVLVALSTVAGFVGLVLITFRDADPDAQADYLGADTVASAPRVTESFWPVVGAFGAATMALGLVLHTAVFVAGLALCAVVAIEWLMDAWADRATGDPVANKQLRDRIMAPIEIPALGAGMVAVGVLAVSRIFLSVSKNGAVVAAGVVAVAILATAVLYVAKPQLGKNLVAGIVLLLAVGVLAGGVLAAVEGERDFEVHGEEHSEGSDEVEHSDEGSTDESGENSSDE